MTNASRKDYAAYAFYSATSMLAVFMILGYFTIFLTDNVKISAALVGTLLVVSRAIDFVVGLVAGGIMQGQTAKKRYSGFWLKILRFVLFIGMVLAFTDTSALPVPVRVILSALAYLMANCSMNFLQPAQFNAVSDLCGTNMGNRQKMAALGAQAMVIAQLVISLISMPLVIALTPVVGQSNGYLIAAAVFAFPILISAHILSKAVKPHEEKRMQQETGPKITVGDMIKSVGRNKQLLVFVVAYGVFCTSYFLLTSIMPYYFIYVTGGPAMIATAMTISVIAGFIGSMIAPALVKVTGKKMIFVIGNIVGVIGFALIALSKTSMVLFITGYSLIVLGQYLFFVFLANYAQDVGEYDLWKTGKDNRAVALGIINMPIKIGIILGGAIATYGLSLIGYSAGMEVTDAFVSNFMVIIGVIPAAILVVSTLVMLFGYKISDADAAKYTKENAERLASKTHTA